MILKIKRGKRKTWVNWCKSVMTKHYAEATETMDEEDLLKEQCIVFDFGKESYLLYIHTTKKGKKKKPANLERALNRKHFKKFHECLKVMKRTEDGYLLEAK